MTGRVADDLEHLLEDVRSGSSSTARSRRPGPCTRWRTPYGRCRPGAAEALVDWGGSEIARLRAFGIVHGVVVRDLGSRDRARFCATLDAGPGARGHARRSEHAEQIIRAPAEPALHPPVGPAADRGRRRRGVPVPQPQELGGAGVPAPRRTAADPEPARRPALRRGGRSARRAPLEPGRDPARAGRRTPRSTATRCTSGSRRTRRSTWTSSRGGDWDDAVQLAGLGMDLLDGFTTQNAEAYESWLLSAAPAGRGRHRGDPARGGAGPSGSRRPRPGSRSRDAGGRAEPARREPPGAADPALPPRRRRRRGRAPVRGVVRTRGAGARLAARGPGRCRRMRETTAGRPQVDEASINAVIEAGAAAVVRRRPGGRRRVVRDRGPHGRRGRRGEPAGRDPTGARRGTDPLPGRAGRGGPGDPDRGGPDRARRRERRGRGRAGPRRARVRRLPARPLRPRRAVLAAGAAPSRRSRRRSRRRP